MASLRGVLRKIKKYSPGLQLISKVEKDLPGSMGALINATTAENVSSNPYKQGERSRFDMFAGGERLSRKEENRRIGRAAGTAVGAWFVAPAAGASISATEAASLGVAADSLSATPIEEEVVPGGEADREPIPAVPTKANAAALLEAARGSLDPLTGGRRRRGRASLILTGGEGAGLPTTATKALLGG
jgi:hypothetical protein